MATLKSQAEALIEYANGVTGKSDASLGDCVKSLADYYGGSSESVFPTITDADLLSSQVQALITYANSVDGKSDVTLGDAMRSLADGTPQWMRDAAETYGLDIANLKQAMQDYTFVDYLQSSGVQYINTGVTSTDFTTDLNINIDMQYTEEQSYGLNGWNSGGQFGQKNGLWSTETTVSTVSALSRTRLKVHFSLSQRTEELLVNDEQICMRKFATSISSYVIKGYPIFVALTSSGYVYNPSKCIVYSCYMLNEEDVNLRFLLPCLRKSDSKPMMLDLTTMTEYVNQGSGDDFTYGDEVTLEAKFAELS